MSRGMPERDVSDSNFDTPGNTKDGKWSYTRIALVNEGMNKGMPYSQPQAEPQPDRVSSWSVNRQNLSYFSSI